MGALVAAAFALIRLRRSYRSAGGPEARDALTLLVLETATFLSLSLMISRLSVFAVFFLAVFGGGGFARLPSLAGKCAAVVALAATAIVLACNAPGLLPGGWLHLPVPTSIRPAAERFRPISQVDQSLYRWIALETPAASTFLGRFGLLPPVLAYADRPVVLHSKFEVPGIREKVEAHFLALFAREEQLASFCDRQGADYYLHDPFTVLGTGTESARYMAGRRRVPNGSAAFVMQFAPERLRRFQLVYQNALYRVYRRTDQPAPFDPAKFPYQPIYDPKRFQVDPTGEFFSDGATESVLQGLQRGNDSLRQAVQLFAAGRWPEAYGLYRRALAHCPSLPYAHSHMARILLDAGRVSEALGEAEQAVRADPFEPEGWFHLALIQAKLGDRIAARRSLQECRRSRSGVPGTKRGVCGGAEIKLSLRSSTHRL